MSTDDSIQQSVPSDQNKAGSNTLQRELSSKHTTARGLCQSASLCGAPKSRDLVMEDEKPLHGMFHFGLLSILHRQLLLELAL